MPDDDEAWHDHINKMEDESKNAYFREKDAKELQERLKTDGKMAHICPNCSEVFECDRP
jgi:hypothetical protein